MLCYVVPFCLCVLCSLQCLFNITFSNVFTFWVFVRNVFSISLTFAFFSLSDRSIATLQTFQARHQIQNHCPYKHDLMCTFPISFSTPPSHPPPPSPPYNLLFFKFYLEFSLRFLFLQYFPLFILFFLLEIFVLFCCTGIEAMSLKSGYKKAK